VCLKANGKISVGSELFVYVSEAPSVEEGKVDHKIGIAKIKSCKGYKTRKELIEV